MKVQLGSYYLDGLSDVLDHQPDDPDEFCLNLSFDVTAADGTQGILGNFGVSICTPKWMDHYLNVEDMQLGRHIIIVKRWDPERVMGYVRHFVESIEAETWEELAELISRIARWEDELDPFMDWEKY